MSHLRRILLQPYRSVVRSALGAVGAYQAAGGAVSHRGHIDESTPRIHHLVKTYAKLTKYSQLWSLESLLVAGNFGLDVLYTLTDETTDYRIYTGGGLNTRLYFYFPNGFDLRAVVGGEYFFAGENGSAPLGVFGEVCTYLKGLLTGYPTVEGRVGINLTL